MENAGSYAANVNPKRPGTKARSPPHVNASVCYGPGLGARAAYLQ